MLRVCGPGLCLLVLALRSLRCFLLLSCSGCLRLCARISFFLSFMSGLCDLLDGSIF